MMERSTMSGKEYLVYEVIPERAADLVGINMLEHNNISGLMPFKFVHEETRDYYRYDVVSSESLAEWLLSRRSKTEVMQLIGSILQVYEEMPAYLLNKEQLLTEITEISVSDGKCLFAYVPDPEIKGDCTVLIQRILSRIKYPMDEDYSYIFDLQNAYSRGEIRTIPDVKKWLKIVNGELPEAVRNEENPVPQPVQQPVQPAPAPAAEPVRREPAAQQQKPAEKKEAVNDIFAEFGIPVSTKADNREKVKAEKPEKPEKEKKSGLKLFGKKKPEQKSEEQSMEQKSPEPVKAQTPIVINDLNRGNKTVLIECGGSSEMPSLIRDMNRQAYPLRAGENVIGSGKDADIRLGDNTAISRKHARLFVSNGDYYIEDLGSTNGTCVNGETLSPHVPCLIRDMAHIKISNETFTFNLRS